MPTVSHAVTVDATPETVWAFVSDMERIPSWVSFTDEMRRYDEGPVREGFAYVEYGGVGPMRGESEWEVVECDPPHGQVHVGDLGVTEPRLTIDIETAGDGLTRWTQTVEFEALPQFRPLGRLLEVLVLRRLLDRDLQRTIETGRVQVERYARTAGTDVGVDASAGPTA
jgi:carbon monoxide dehydrogenase subunit G